MDQCLITVYPLCWKNVLLPFTLSAGQMYYYRFNPLLDKCPTTVTLSSGKMSYYRLTSLLDKCPPTVNPFPGQISCYRLPCWTNILLPLPTLLDKCPTTVYHLCWTNVLQPLSPGLSSTNVLQLFTLAVG